MGTERVVSEIKRTLDGDERIYRCTLVSLAHDYAALRYVSDRAARVGSLVLPAGTVTIAHYWTERPYTAYHWLTPGGRTLGVYLNAASDVAVAPDAIRWRDLALDVLVMPDGPVEVLDDDEADHAPASARPVIAGIRAHLLAQAVQIAREVDALTRAIWPPASRAARGAERTS